jgi:hypothetical protein
MDGNTAGRKDAKLRASSVNRNDSRPMLPPIESEPQDRRWSSRGRKAGLVPPPGLKGFLEASSCGPYSRPCDRTHALRRSAKNSRHGTQRSRALESTSRSAARVANRVFDLDGRAEREVPRFCRPSTDTFPRCHLPCSRESFLQCSRRSRHRHQQDRSLRIADSPFRGAFGHTAPHQNRRTVGTC